MGRLYCALIHYPIKDREGQRITTAVTNLDIHDIARSARTYGLERYFVVTPIAAQRLLVERIIGHWREGAGLKRVPDRGEALRLVEPVESLEQVTERIQALDGQPPLTIATAARAPDGCALVEFEPLATELAQSDRPALILFGTGHGMETELLSRCDRLLVPIHGAGDGYNHLSVRSAAAIVFDRLRGGSQPCGAVDETPAPC